MKILKFGGSSVKNASAMKNVFNILDEYNDKIIVILSACGGITNLITDSITSAAIDDSYKKNIDKIKSHHYDICNSLIDDKSVKEETLKKVNELINGLQEIHEGVNLLRECTPKSLDQALSFGELLSTNVFFGFLKSNGKKANILNSSRIIKTDSNYNSANINSKLTSDQFKNIVIPEILDYEIIVAQGFIATDENNNTTTLGRGGSDYTASLFGAFLKEHNVDVEEIQIWTDVSGVLSGDPRKFFNTKTVPVMTFAEIRELSFYGAKVLHPNTIKPAHQAQIPVKVLNTYVPLNPGTTIVDEYPDNNYRLHSAVLKENCILHRKIVTARENSHKFLSKSLKDSINNNNKVLFSNSTESSISLILEESDDIKLNDFSSQEVSIICLSGANITTDTKGQILLDIASVLSDNMPLQIVYGSSDVSILMTYEKNKAKKAIKSIHELIISKYL